MKNLPSIIQNIAIILFSICLLVLSNGIHKLNERMDSLEADALPFRLTMDNKVSSYDTQVFLNTVCKGEVVGGEKDKCFGRWMFENLTLQQFVDLLMKQLDLKYVPASNTQTKARLEKNK